MPTRKPTAKPATTDQIEGSTQSTTPTWDGSPTTKRDWYSRLAEYLRLLNPRYKQLWEEGSTQGKDNITLTVSSTHSNEIEAGYVQLLRFEVVCGTLPEGF